MSKKIKTKSRAGKVKRRPRPCPYEFRIKMVRLYMEEGYRTTVLKEQFGVNGHSVQRWIKAYREQGTEVLIVKPTTGSKPKLPKTVKRRIVGIKKKHPEYGPHRIADVLKRLGATRAMVIHGHSGLCDLSVTGPSRITELADGQITTYEVDPADLGVSVSKLDDLLVDSPDASAAAVRDVLAGKAGA